MRALNYIQTLTPEQQQRTYFAIVETDQVQADGTRQTADKAYIRTRAGQEIYVKDLPKIDQDNPQPNGDYAIVINNNHSDLVEDQSGIGWLYIGDDGYMHMMYCLSTNKAAEAIRPLAEDHMLQFSTEGNLNSMEDDGSFGQFWIYCVAPVQVGNDPGTQSANNQVKKGNIMPDTETKPLTKEQVAEAVKTELSQHFKNANEKMDPGEVMQAVAELFTKLGITDAKWMADITSDFLSASAGLPYHAPGDNSSDTDDSSTPVDPNEPVATPNAASKDEKKSNGAKTVNVGGFKPVVKQNNATSVAKVGKTDFDHFKESDEYKEAYGRAIIYNGLHNPMNSMDQVGNVPGPIANTLKKNGITFNPGEVDLAPEYLITKITELLQSENNILSHINFFNGLNQFTVPAFVTQTTYAKGRAPGSVSEKKAQEATIQPRLITSQTLFKFVTLPNDFVEHSGGLTGSAVIDWVNRELPAKTIRSAEEALLIGGVTNDDPNSTPFTAIHSILDDVTAPGSVYGEVYQPQAGESFLKQLSNAAGHIELLDNAVANTGVYLIISRTDFRDLINQAMIGSGEYPANLAGSPEQVAAFLGVDGIIQVPWLRASSHETGHNAKIDAYMAAYKAMLVNLSAVDGVGQLSPQALSQYYLRANSFDFESKLMIGAALASPWAVSLIPRNPTTPSSQSDTYQAPAEVPQPPQAAPQVPAEQQQA